MLLDVLQIGLDGLLAVIGMVHLDAVDGDLCAQAIEQGGIVVGEAALTPSGMGDEAERAAAMGGCDRLTHIRHNRAEASPLNALQALASIGRVPVGNQKANIIGRET